MSELKNDCYLRALFRKSTDYTPIWIMRQAGRYLPEYQSIRKKAGDFMSLCKTPELACEVTLQPLERYPLDAAILFSDILTIPDAMGLELYFCPGEGPKFKKNIHSLNDIIQLPIPDPEQELNYVMQSIRLIRHHLANKVPLIGFSGSPWTLAAYMIEGGSSKSFSKIKKLLYQEPLILHTLLHKLTESVVLYLKAQIIAGVQSIMIFDTWGGLLTTSCYQDFSLSYIAKIINQLKSSAVGKDIPITLYTKGAGGQWLDKISAIGCDAVGLDWTVDMRLAKSLVGQKVALQGNMDPFALYGSRETIETEVKSILANYGLGQGHIFNLGHGIDQNVPPENVAILVDAVHNLSRSYHHR